MPLANVVDIVLQSSSASTRLCTSSLLNEPENRVDYSLSFSFPHLFHNHSFELIRGEKVALKYLCAIRS